MKVKCEYCGNYLSDTEEKCPSCMAPNEHLRRVSNAVPQTIEELKEWYVSHNLPPEDVTRFFIGKNMKGPRAFGIYYDERTGNYVVYKNKDNGQRAVRYEGKDEAYAVNELYLKLKEEIMHQKGLNQARNFSSSRTYPQNSPNIIRAKIISCFFAFIVLFTIIPLILSIVNNELYSGYYAYDNTPYYLYGKCLISESKKCEWYRYDPNKSEWSQAKDVNAKKMKYVGQNWDQHLGIDITKKLQDEDFFKELHPPQPSTGYYQYNGQTYYYYNNSWYIYNNNSWSESSEPSHDVKINPSDYYDDSSANEETYGFKDSGYYHSYSSSSSDDYDSSWSSSSNDSWDSGSSWDSNDSWDSGSTDWDSDW